MPDRVAGLSANSGCLVIYPGKRRTMISTIVSIPRFLFRTVLLIAFLLLGLFPTLMLINHYRRKGNEESARKSDRVAVRLANRLTWVFGISVDVRGTPAVGAVLLAANHISWLDIIVLHSSCAMGFVGKAEIDSWPLFSYMARTGGTIFHQRGDHDSAAGVSSAMVERLKQGRAVTIFPEGGIKPGSTSVRVFHARLFRAAVEVGCPVQPVRIRYMRNGHRDDDIIFRDNENMMMNIGRMLARPGALAEIHFMPEIDASDQPRRALADAAREAVVKSYES